MPRPITDTDLREVLDGLHLVVGVVEIATDREGAVDAPIADEDEPVPPEVAATAHGAYAELVEQATDHTPDEEEIAGMTAYQMAATVDFGLDAKQGLLDLRSESARLALAARLFRAALKRLDFVERVTAEGDGDSGDSEPSDGDPAGRRTGRAARGLPQWR